VLDQAGIDPGALDDGPDRGRREVVGPYGGERAAVPPDRRPDRLDDPGVANGPTVITGHAIDCRGAPDRARPRRRLDLRAMMSAKTRGCGWGRSRHEGSNARPSLRSCDAEGHTALGVVHCRVRTSRVAQRVRIARGLAVGV